LTAEAYDWQQRNISLIGGIWYPLKFWNNSEIAEYVLQRASEYPELNSKSKLEHLALSFGFSLPTTSDNTPTISIGRDGGLKDSLLTLPKDTLTKFALALEQYWKDKKNFTLIGGLNDYIGTMSPNAVSDYILNKLKEFKELTTLKQLEELAKKYGLISESPQSFLQLGGLEDVIIRQTKATLVAWALTAENYERVVEGVMLIGGLEDYVDKMTEQELATYILDMARKYPKINSAETLNALAFEYKYLQAPRSLWFL